MADIRFFNRAQIVDRILSLLPPEWQANFVGKVLFRLLVAFAAELEQVYGLLQRLIRLSFFATSTGQFLRDLTGGIGLDAREGAPATVELTFMRPVPGDPVTIPQGTVAVSVSGVGFATTAEVVLPNGATSINATAVAERQGTDGNIAANRIVGIRGGLAGITGVRNDNPATGGTDPETDEELRARVPPYIASLARATPQAIGARLADTELYPEIFDFRVEQDFRAPGYIRIILADQNGSDVYRPDPGSWTANGDGTYTATVGFTSVSGVVIAGFPGLRFGVPERLDTGRLVFAASSPPIPNTGGLRFFAADGLGNLTVYAGGLNPNTLDITIYADLFDRVLADLEINYVAAGVGIDLIAPFAVRAPVSVTYDLEAGFVQSEVEAALNQAVSDYVSTLNLGQDFEREGLFVRLAGVPGAAGVLVPNPANNIAIGRDSVFRLQGSPQILRR